MLWRVDNVDTQEQILGSIQKDNFKMEGLEIWNYFQLTINVYSISP